LQAIISFAIFATLETELNEMNNDLENHMMIPVVNDVYRASDRVTHAQAVNREFNNTDEATVEESLIEAATGRYELIRSAIIDEDATLLGQILLQDARAYLMRVAIEDVNNKGFSE
jgi:hypothetical protein